ncbi:DUF3078 domain-containing protein [Gillisia limnaea]|uniref:DUF3078 domain-containing protein n=1 Tax=Gillisia limnaea (strain DSM 15749 / LMG 21470 / R-8282) TaxID=865937 RepID=H2BVJ8_GILLR|nr:DUF3078 domain-containing protein [Gillisia limnaea]EHQ02906.1 hypothetical protein Gilli_2275 [Gillisia limnaea DSM 15749]
MQPKLFLILCLLFNFSFGSAKEYYLVKKDTVQNDTVAIDSVITEAQEEVIILWTEKNAVGVNFNEVAFINWNAGGNNSISANFYGNFERNYKKDLLSWKTNASIRYGLNAQEGRELRKTDDQIMFNSTAGYRRDSTSNFRYSAKFNFNTQFASGFRYPNTQNPISKFMAPAYAFLGIGSEYTHPKEDLTVYLSPVTQKSTFVLDQGFANEGRFGVTPAVRDEEGNIIEKGEKVRTEFGMLLTSGFSKEIFSNVKLDNQLSLYSDYLNNFGNIDVDWELNLNLTVNDFVKASIGSHLKYDDDIKVQGDVNDDGEQESLGPKIQFKQMLGVGLVYEF